LIFIAVFWGCEDIDRDNILDPKNPASERPQIITVEAFVNTTDSIFNDYNRHLLLALNDFKADYNEKITIAEHHRKINNQYDDGYVLINSEILYDNYFQGFANGIKGVPDVFINGIEARVQGASSPASVLFRLQQAIDSLVSKNSFFTIEPDIIKDGNEYNISATIARLGSTDAEDILLKAIITTEFDNNLHQRVVTEILKSQVISKFANGEIKEVNLGDVSISQYESKVIFMITSEDELDVWQSLKVDLN
jgi:hypothetical protein